MLRRFSINFALLSMAFDACAVVIGLWLSALMRPFLNDFLWFKTVLLPELVPSVLYILFPVVWLVIYASFSIYDGRKYLRVFDEFAALSLAVLISSVSSAGVLYFSYRQVSRALFVVFILLTYAICLIWRIFIRMYFRQQKVPSDRIRRIVVVGAGTLGQRVKEQLLLFGSPNLIFVGFLDSSFAFADSIPILGKPENIRALLTEHAITDVVIALPHSAYNQMGDIVQRMDDIPVQVWVALGFFDLALYKTSIEDFAGIPMLDLRASAIDDYQHMVKRAFDVIFGLFALVLAIPLMTLSALLVYLDDGAPVLFKQTRVGANGRLFEMLKFRTMVRNAEQLQDQVEARDEAGNFIYKTKEDPRVTRAGRYLRRFSLDELPQFFNVMRGDMSLVGPRPELPHLVDKYQPWQRKRFSVPPGITGWWQVNGRSDKPMHLHTEDDIYYINNYSMILDIQILIKTIWVVLFGKGAY